MKNTLLAALGALLCLSLTACLDVESTRLSVDLENNRAELIYENIVSNASTEKDLKEDFQGLLLTAYERKGEGQEVSLVTSELYEEDGVLNGRRTYIVNDMDIFLERHEITQDYRGYIFDMKEEDVKYTDGNGIYIESSAGKQIIWDKNSAVLEMEMSYDFSGKELISMLPQWKEWRKWDIVGGPDTAKILERELSEVIKTKPDENVIEFCPNSACYSFSTRLATEGSFRRLADFAYIYLFNLMDDPVLEDLKALGEDLTIVERNMLDCPKADELDNAKCAMRNLTANYFIKLHSIEYEELESQKTEIDLEVELAP